MKIGYVLKVIRGERHSQIKYHKPCFFNKNSPFSNMSLHIHQIARLKNGTVARNQKFITVFTKTYHWALP